MRRRDLVKVIAGAAVWPIAAHAQQPEKMRRIGVLSSLAETDPEAHAWDDAFRSRLIELQWIDGRNVHIDYRWGAGDVDRMRHFAPELVRLNPDVLVGISTPATAALQAATRTIPIVFAWVSDPVGSGFVSSLANPGGNITGFLNIESSVIGKWLALMHEIAPQVSRIGFSVQSTDSALCSILFGYVPIRRVGACDLSDQRPCSRHRRSRILYDETRSRSWRRPHHHVGHFD